MRRTRDLLRVAQEPRISARDRDVFGASAWLQRIADLGSAYEARGSKDLFADVYVPPLEELVTATLAPEADTLEAILGDIHTFAPDSLVKLVEKELSRRKLRKALSAVVAGAWETCIEILRRQRP